MAMVIIVVWGQESVKDFSKFAEQKQNELFNDLRAIKSISDDKPQKFHKSSTR